MEEEVKLKLSTYLELRDEITKLKESNKHHIASAFGFLSNIVDKLDSDTIMYAMTKAGYTVRLKANGRITELGKGDKLIIIEGNEYGK